MLLECCSVIIEVDLTWFILQYMQLFNEIMAVK